MSHPPAMRIAVVADVHANLDSLEAVAADWGAVDQIWSLGDVVGYGPQPRECIAFLREREAIGVPGNHDYGAIGKLDPTWFNRTARRALEWTADQLSSGDNAYLAGLPLTRVEHGFLLAHGSPRDPIEEYLSDSDAAAQSFAAFSEPAAFVGHTHVPRLFAAHRARGMFGPRLAVDDIPLTLGQPVPVPAAPDDPAGRLILNPGSVGQPRDGSPRASYGILTRDADGRWTFDLRRVHYDVCAVQRKIEAAGLPSSLAERLPFGR